MAQPTKGRLLIVDDEEELRDALRESLAEAGYEAMAARSGEEAIQTLTRQDVDLVLSDLMMPGIGGIELLRRALEQDPNLIGIIMTGQGTISTAVEAMKLGAFDYLLKPFKLNGVLPILERAMDVRRLRQENLRLRQYVEHLKFESPRYQLVGKSPGMQRVVHLLEKVAPTDATVLIRGPSGTGKELVARALHHNSLRKQEPLVIVNCAALQETLLESELFGHEKGAFTGALQAKPGLFEVAEGGTLFIDEIAETSPALQAKLLRVLEDRRYRRVGGTKEFQANVRIIAATNKPLEEEQKAGRFREDLFYRLNVVTIDLPPLRERREEIPALVEHFLTTRLLCQTRCRVAPEALEALTQYGWPGNVRELANVLERAQILADDGLITLEHLPEQILEAESDPGQVNPQSRNLDELERHAVQTALAEAKGNKVHAAKALGISRRALYRLIARYGFDQQRT